MKNRPTVFFVEGGSGNRSSLNVKFFFLNVPLQMLLETLLALSVEIKFSALNSWMNSINILQTSESSIFNWIFCSVHFNTKSEENETRERQFTFSPQQLEATLHTNANNSRRSSVTSQVFVIFEFKNSLIVFKLLSPKN